ncbi:conserved hypothetical protein [Candidatus Methylobacter favarea]|uniref:DUF3240 domain-containing protein n=1 Tax=Candidatus Methylobacter favarea TaxID=2707345 RepID=A0A8S0WYC5_9GAMM|nr:DUF3240 family protein [Candidatus Methylobacter favarea]CAA9889513.1 conserved hypothetical protein [Candidatus Methylobacter favarea]
MSSKDYMITLNIPPSLEDIMVDSLLMLEAEHGFSSFQVNAHHHENKGLSLAEQVTGRQSLIRFQMYVSAQELGALLELLRQEFSGSGIQYWVLPVIEHGFI